jgi:hypothetical protein
MILSAYKEFESRAGMIASAKGAKTNLVMDMIDKTNSDFSISDLIKKCPSVSIDMIRKIINDEKKKGKLKPIGFGRDAKWRKVK